MMASFRDPNIPAAKLIDWEEKLITEMVHVLGEMEEVLNHIGML